ncbi:hypothetical protein [Xanthobacter tagetidis]|jgi:hypothetical protein|uniref:Uncharacterized protein n=1 Tax=Xanthobacter tagetidis TaxID=60216 RepID=A0A3L7AQA0_9HYPH|nr:hypothetical protein [Xanthobacter tagetidis]MBB6308007.1 hypothetical protein [Xanthobacter tagetidis]RLP81648.1 hypothetical protein D9R14_01200 [Xanthobacter tagetidis]
MTITINLPIFPLRREIAALKRHLGRKLTTPAATRASASVREDTRYSLDGFEFDVAAMAHLPQGPRSAR